MDSKTYSFKAKLWIYDGPAAWHFITLPQDVAEDIELHYGHVKRGWGSLPVEVQVGQTKWSTSIFTDKKSGSFLLPIKSKVRQQAGITAADSPEFILKISS